MQQLLRLYIENEKKNVIALRDALMKAFEILGNMYAPLFFCIACMHGIATPFLVVNGGDMLNALLGSRGIGVLTSEAVANVWMTIVALLIFFITKFFLNKLEGKIFQTFENLTRIVNTCALLIISISSPGIFCMNIFFISAWRLSNKIKIQVTMLFAWIGALTWIVFSLATDIAKRVSTLGDGVAMGAIMTLVLIVTTRDFFTSIKK